MNNVAIGRRVSQLRSKIGMSTEQLAERIGKSPSTISRIENGKQKATIELVALIARVLNTHPFSLLSDKSEISMSNITPNALPVYPETKRDNCLGRLIATARHRSRLSLSEAARELQIEEEELQNYENGCAKLPAELLERIATLYPIDMDALMGIAYIEDNFPSLARRFGMMEGLLSVFYAWLRQNHSAAGHQKWAEIANDVESVIGLFDHTMMGAERPAEYFSIGHLSNRLLAALQNPEFHAKVEKLANNYTEATDKSESTGESGPPATPDGDSNF